MASVNHIGIATESLDDSQIIWDALGFSHSHDELLEEQGVKVRYMKGESLTTIELLEPLSVESPVGRFISKRGPGIQQIAINVDDIESKILHLKSIGIKMINEVPITGTNGHRIAFIHPSSCQGVLIELVESK